MRCRFCKNEVNDVFLDLGFQPPSNSYLTSDDLKSYEITYPLRLFVCNNCWLVQTEDFVKETTFFNEDYAYFSSTSVTWVEHAEKYSKMIINKLKLDINSLVIEIASNDGYLLKNFKKEQIPCIGIEPTKSTADASEKIGINVLKEFFNENLANNLVSNLNYADLVIGNNVYAHVPDLNDFTKSMNLILKPEGVVTLEFPHLQKLIEFNQFDTVYHEHFSYFSFYTVTEIFKKHGLKIFDVEKLETHGGSLRIYGCKISANHKISDNVETLLNEEQAYGMKNLSFYINFQKSVNVIKNDLLTFLIENVNNGKIIAAYGAAAKGNTLLNYCGIKSDLIKYVSDAAIAKQGKFLPGSHIPIENPDYLSSNKPDYVIILPWNIADEVIKQNIELYNTNVQFFKAIPKLTLL
jgi:SAM-dependent methyltransferase